MAERRMFAKSVIDSDIFLDMPLSTQALYFHLSMRADDDGFINNVKRIMRMTGCSEDDMKILIMKRFIIPFSSGIVVVTHWKVHNYIQKDRYRPSQLPEKQLVVLGKNNIYEIQLQEDEPKCIQDVSEMETECVHDGYVGKDRVSIGKSRVRLNNIRPSDKQMNELFDEIWNLYPRKEGRKKAFEAFKRSLKHGADIEDIRKGILNYIEQIRINRTDRNYIKMGSTYFTQESWNDEYGTVSSAPTSEDYDREASITDELDINKL